MLDLIKQILTSPAGSFGFVAAFVILIAWFAFWIYGKFVMLVENHKTLTAKCNAVESASTDRCERLDRKIEDLRNDMHEVKGDMQFVKSTLNNIVNMIQTSGASALQAHSPLTLSEFGLKMAEGMGADAILQRCFLTIRAKIDADVVAKTPYDVQTYCLEKIPVFPENYLDTAAIDAVKKYAYDNGRTLFECLKVIGIKARDQYFKVTGIS